MQVAVSVLPGPGDRGASGTDPLTRACGQDPGIACRLVWDVTHSGRAAQLTNVFFAGPATMALRILLVLALAIVVRGVLHRLIRRLTLRASASEPNGDRPHSLFRERRRQRATALGSLLGNIASLTVFSIAAVIILGDLGMNLAPVLASAGVVGVAVGFGAQNLVQDFLAGIFMLMEDQYGVGDVISVGTITGTVEAVTLRITRLRDIDGIVWHIRNGTISKAGNQSHGWARAVIDFPVRPDADLRQVRELMSQAAASMAAEPAWRAAILEDPQVLGVQEVSSQQMTVRIAVKTAPLRQWQVARELRERLQASLSDLAAVGAASMPSITPVPVPVSAVVGIQQEGPAGGPHARAGRPERPGAEPEAGPGGLRGGSGGQYA